MSSQVRPRRRRIGLRERMRMMPRWGQILLLVALALFCYALPLLNPPFISPPGTDFSGVLFTVAVYALIALGLNIVVGYAGLLDLGYVGFYAIGAYTVGILTSEHATWTWLASLPAAIVITMLSGVLLGWPTLRVRGDYLAIVTLGFGEIVRLNLINQEWLGGAPGISGIARPPSIPLFELPHLDWSTGVPLVDLDNTSTFLVFGVLDITPYYWLALTFVILIMLADRRVKNSRVGRAWEATREDEDAAELMGVPTFRFKLLAFALGAFVGGIAGALFAGRQGFINPETFTLLLSILFISAVVVGGQGNRWGVLLGAIVVAYLPERFRGFEQWRVLVFGIALVVLATYRPQGLLPPRRTVRAQKMEEEIEALETSDVAVAGEGPDTGDGPDADGAPPEEKGAGRG
ncbi:branched-chain amino acid ABC transporter permease [Occultella aeris]|uniref:Leucine/isoleucine/valine transporter permease subunit n=1 Tax=Occultella aeris TaxID=2761496 RepID=A0A7M4DLV0_9MICO|nr:branched-chain amino acid ABC transporter permease [Occultella aeris]VZO38280.1 leucine/isoleucine/valine transporter permease subunit [Occultella aeris]